MGAAENIPFYTSQDPYEFFKDLAEKDPRIDFLLRAFEEDIELGRSNPEEQIEELRETIDELTTERAELERKLARFETRNMFLEQMRDAQQSRPLSKLQDDRYELVTSDDEIELLAVAHGFDEDQVTGVLLWLIDGEIEQLWITTWSEPYRLTSIYDRWF